jgi:cobalamin biosynthesis protein CobW
MKPPIPVTVVSGFLGSGKTTLLCDLLQHRQEMRLAVLINEIGEVSVDGALARASADDVGGTSGTGRADGTQDVEIVDFPSGLIAYAEDNRFVPTLQAIARRPGRVDHVLIETSGVALPSAAMERLQSPELAGEFVLDATLVVVDTPRLLAGEFGWAPVSGAVRVVGAVGAGTAGAVDAVGSVGSMGVATTVGAASGLDSAGSVDAARLLFDQQLAGADVVVLNKIDELDTDALLAAEEQVRRRAPNVRFLELAHNAQLDVRLALGLRLHQATARPQHFHGPFTAMPGRDTQTLSDHGRVDGHIHTGLAAHSHGLSTHTHFHEQDPGWLSFTLRSSEQHDVSCLRDALESVAQTESLLRCKGFVLSAEAGRYVLFQGVRTRVMLSDAAPAQLPKDSELVFIGYHLSRARIAATLSRLTGKAWS